jgi:ADP-heptose:LPS heptosyltransferase
LLTGGIGDKLMALPAIRQIRAEYRDSHFTIIATGVTPPFWEEEADQIFTLSHSRNWQKALLAKEGFDMCFVNTVGFFDIWSEVAAFVSGARDLRGPRSTDMSDGETVYTRPFPFGGGHETLVNLLGAGGASDEARVPYPLRIPENIRLPMNPATVVFHPGSSDAGHANRWSPANFASVARELIDNGFRVVLLGNSSEAELLARIKAESERPLEIVADLTLRDVALLLASAGLVIANDSGIGHLAASVQAPLITIMGANLPERVAPAGNNVTIVGPRCNRGGCYGRIPASECSRCIDLITPEEVLNAALEKLPAPALP